MTTTAKPLKKKRSYDSSAKRFVYESDVKFFEDLRNFLREKDPSVVVEYNKNLLVIARGASAAREDLLPERISMQWKEKSVHA